MVLQADVADASALSEALRTASAKQGPPRLVVHAAGVLSGAPLTYMGAADLAASLSPKVRGAWNLHRATAELDLQAMVFVSSAASVLGLPRYAGYSAANAFLDALAAHRRAAGLPTTSVSFGPLAGPSIGEALRFPGLPPVDPGEALAEMFSALAAGAAHRLVLRVDSDAWSRLYPDRAGLARTVATPMEPAARSRLGEALLTATPERRLGLLRRHVAAELAAVLRIDDDEVTPDLPFSALGLDSILGVELRDRLQEALGFELSATLAWSFPTLDRLVEHLGGRVALEGGAGPGRPAPANSPTRDAPAEPATEPIAIVGMGCRFPGGANSPAAFWRLLIDGVDGIAELPADRRGAAAAFQWGGIIEVDRFDPGFFGISASEARKMDPQQRIFLEVAWEAIEDAGLTVARLRGSRTGVFAAALNYNAEYSRRLLSGSDTVDAFVGPGVSHGVLAGRLAYTFDLRGPCLTVDTACSSSLVAVHLACGSLLARECEVAVAGEVNLVLGPDFTEATARMGLLSADGRCKPFDDSADGIVRSDGCGVVVLKRLTDALAHGDRVYGLVAGSAINHGGRSNGLTAPSGHAQHAFIRQALERAGMPASALGYVEAHGTGTPLGDPIELEALAEVLGERSSDGLCVVGSVKSNIGHCEAAAGMAGLIKVLLCFQKGWIPPQLHLRTVNSHIPLARMPIMLARSAVPWPERGERARLAGVSSFGWSGTNAHVVLAEPAPPRSLGGNEAPQTWLLPLSAGHEDGLRTLAEAWLVLLRRSDRHPLADLCHTAARRRTHHAIRKVFAGSTGEHVARLSRDGWAGLRRRHDPTTALLPK